MSAYKNIVNLLVGATFTKQEVKTLNALLATREGDKKPRRRRSTATSVVATKKKKAAGKAPKKKATINLMAFDAAS